MDLQVGDRYFVQFTPCTARSTTPTRFRCNYKQSVFVGSSSCQRAASTGRSKGCTTSSACLSKVGVRRYANAGPGGTEPERLSLSVLSSIPLIHTQNPPDDIQADIVKCELSASRGRLTDMKWNQPSRSIFLTS
jgi:hypothetical protein